MSDDRPDLTRERARTERRDLDKERGEPVPGGAVRGGPRTLRKGAAPAPEWDSRPRILVTNDDGVESRGLLALKMALDPIGDVTVVAPDTNQSAVGHQKTLMRPLRVRERTLGDGSLAYTVDGSPTDAVSLAFLGYFDHGFDLVASGINYGANLGDDITYSGTVSAAMEAVINNCPALRDLAGVLRTPGLLDLAAAGDDDRRAQRPRARALAGRAHQRQRAGGLLEECAGKFEVTRLGKRIYQDELVARLDPAACRTTGSAARPVGPVRARHRLPRGRQSAHRGHADPSRPDGTKLLEAAADLVVAARGGLTASRQPAYHAPSRTRRRVGGRPWTT